MHHGVPTIFYYKLNKYIIYGHALHEFIVLTLSYNKLLFMTNVRARMIVS